MAQYSKYMFDNFVVDAPEDATDDSALNENIVDDSDSILPSIEIKNTFVDVSEVIEEQVVSKSYTQEEYDSAVKEAESRGFSKALAEMSDSESARQIALEAELNNRLMALFAAQTENRDALENSALKFAVGLVRKLLPHLETEHAEAEVKTFLADNFANFASQDMLSFSFHPDMVTKIASSLGRLAEQNDFEGKIAVHKDANLGLADCRVEWKSGGVERSNTKILNQIEDIIIANEQEREHGE